MPDARTSTTPEIDGNVSTSLRPRIWGLRADELHDAFWQARGIQCVRLGRQVRLQRAAELYLLVQPGQMVLFDIASLTERLLWRNARITRLRIIDEQGESYGERLVFDDEGNVRAIARRYHRLTNSTARVLLTPSRRLASIWMNATSAREAWMRIRRTAAWSSIDHWRCAGFCFDEGNVESERACMDRLVEFWPQPAQAIEGIRRLGEGIWALDGEEVSSSILLIGPVWAGQGALTGESTFLIGPTCREDREVTPWRAPLAAIRPIHRVELAPKSSDNDTEIELAGWPNSPIKRLIDILGSALALLLLTPILPVLALFVLIDDGRPIFFSHVRQTRGGRSFRCWKFRTMYRNAAEMTKALSQQNQADGPQFFITDDPRVTRVGRSLRLWHLDELPQFWNVLRGQMSLVGPRPSPDDENQFCPAWREARLSVRPGITGLWQLRRTREPGTDFQEWIRYDLEYVRSASLRLDLRILFETARNMIFGRENECD